LAISALERAIDTTSRLGARHPGANPAIYGVDVTREVAYRATGLADHTLDIYRPTGFSGPRPVVMYVHGGGFRLLDKEAVWMAAIAFARRGFLVLSVNYRLAPEHPFPAALQDVSDAWLWTVRNAARLGGDPDRLVVAGESAGGNLITSLAIQATYRRPEPWARRVFDAGVVPSAVVANCGIFQVSDIERLLSPNSLPRVAREWVRDVELGYLGDLAGDEAATELADPLRILEGDARPVRPLPPIFASVGDQDPLLDDTLRLAFALDDLGADREARVYERQGHAFQLFTWRREAKRSWNETFDFLRDRGLVDDPAAVAPVTGRFDPRRARERIIDALAA